jgi:hypothetical protein
MNADALKAESLVRCGLVDGHRGFAGMSATYIVRVGEQSEYLYIYRVSHSLPNPEFLQYF